MAGDDDLLNGALSELLAGTGVAAAVGGALREYSLQVIPSGKPCKRVIYTTKVDWLIHLADGTAGIPDDVALLWRCGPLGVQQRALVRTLVGHFAAPLFFVGDMDPLDLATYATLSAPGDPEAIRAEYLGISAWWLQRCESDLEGQPGKSIRTVLIAMEPEERRGFERLRSTPTNWAGLVGPKGLSLLESGMKLELEGASNRNLYSNSLRADLLHFLFQ